MLKSFKHCLSNLSEKLRNRESRDNQIEAAIFKALSLNIPFVAFSLPHEKFIRFYVNPSGATLGSRFTIKEWLSDCEIDIYDEMSIDQFLEGGYAEVEGDDVDIPKSTFFMDYLDEISDLIDTLKMTGGKCVISRVESFCYPGYDMAKVFSLAAMDAFRAFPDQFVYIFFTSQTGGWLAATPELLLDVDKRTGDFKTLALAGTRSAATESDDWDEKNCLEHEFVVEHIAQALTRHGVNFHRAPTETVNVGRNSHLATNFEGNLSGNSATEIISSLHPTPAIAGFPLKDALGQIESIEKHRRGCYGGTVTYDDSTRSVTYVTLRCVQFNRNGFAFYGGGGITSQSQPRLEWQETANKISTMATIVEKAMSNDFA